VLDRRRAIFSVSEGRAALINGHNELWAEWDRLVAIDEDHPGIDALPRERCELEVLLAPALTSEELEGKRQVVERGDPGDAGLPSVQLSNFEGPAM
jgi:hypothetical protein